MKGDIVRRRTNTADRHQVRDRDDGLPRFLDGMLERVDKPILTIAEVGDVKGICILQRRIHEPAECASRLEHRAVPGVLGKERALRLASRLETCPWPAGTRKELDVHGVILSRQRFQRLPL